MLCTHRSPAGKRDVERRAAEHRKAAETLAEQRLQLMAAEERHAQFDQQRSMLETESAAACCPA